jgi:DNA-binding transcriptional ArsR family regulator
MLDAFKFEWPLKTMKSKQNVLDVLFPKARGEILRLLFGSKRRARYVREILAETDLALRTIQDELKKLKAIGLVTSYSNGYHRFFSANRAHPLCREMVRIAEMSEQLPHIKASDLFRASRFRGRTRRSGHRPRAIPPNRQPNWGIFSKRPPKT